MGYDARARETLPFGYGDEFPAYLSHRAALDMQLIDLMRPLFNKGVRPEAFSDLLLEMHTKTHLRSAIKREHRIAHRRATLDAHRPATGAGDDDAALRAHIAELERERARIIAQLERERARINRELSEARARLHEARRARAAAARGDGDGARRDGARRDGDDAGGAARRDTRAARADAARDAGAPVAPPFSEFGDKSKYAGAVPTGKYCESVYKKVGKSIAVHLANEVKKRGARRLHWDVSYKEAKHLGRYHGNALFKSLVTATNELGEIRIQFHTVTDGQDQFGNQLDAFLETLELYGQPETQLFFTDNPSNDKAYFTEKLPGVLAMQCKLDAAAPPPPSSARPTVTVPPERFKVIKASGEISNLVDAMRDMVAERPRTRRVTSLDLEWDVERTARGLIIRQGRAAVMQLGYENPNGDVCALVVLLAANGPLHPRLLALLRDTRLTFVGRGIEGDLKKLERDFDVSLGTTKRVDLGPFARHRGVVDRHDSLQRLVEVVLEEQLSKAPEIRMSRWSRARLTNLQALYAALDAIKSLEVFFKLLPLEDLTVRLDASEALSGVEVDVVPAHGSRMVTATRAAIGTIDPLDQFAARGRWATPRGSNPASVNATATRRLVTITQVFAKSLVVPGVRNANGYPLTLGDMGDPPFDVVLTVNMLAPSLAHRRVAPPVAVAAPPVAPPVAVAAAAPVAPPAAPPVVPPVEEDNAEEDNAEDDATLARITDAATARAALEARTEPNAEPQGGGDDGDRGVLDAGGDGLDAGGNDDADADADAAGLTMDEIACARAAVAAAVRGIHLFGGEVPLDAPPEVIHDLFSSVVGDAFHFMDRPRVPIHHDAKKGYFVALTAAWFASNEERLEEVKAALRADGFDDEAIEAKMYYNRAWFRERVERVVLPPSQLYWRVRAVFEIYGPMLDKKTGNPLFNADAWKKANNVLREICLGYCSDPPGISFYTQRVTSSGELMVDDRGLALLHCNRGTNDVECVHKQIIATFGSWCTGIEMSDALVAEFRHR